MTTSRIKAVAFDLGETLIDETRLWAMVAQYAGVPEFTLFGMMGGMIQRREHHRSLFGLMQIESVDPNTLGYRLEQRDLYPDVVPIMRQLRAGGYRLGVFGNQPEGTAEQASTLGLPLEVAGSSALWGVAKPDPAFFARIIGEFDLQPDEIVYVGDRLDNDVFPSRDAGMHAVFLRRGPWGYVQSQWPEAEEAPHQIRNLGELPRILERLNNEAEP